MNNGGGPAADYIAELTSYGPMRACGICPDNPDGISRFHANDIHEDPAIVSPVLPEELVNLNDQSLQHDTCNGISYILAFPDGSTLCPKSFWNAHSGWGVFYGLNSPHNIASKLHGKYQETFRAELRAI